MTDWYQEGYDKGYEDGKEGIAERPSSFLDPLLNDEIQQEWENGYDAGHADGKEEYDREEDD